MFSEAAVSQKVVIPAEERHPGENRGGNPENIAVKLGWIPARASLGRNDEEGNRVT